MKKFAVLLSTVCITCHADEKPAPLNDSHSCRDPFIYDRVLLDRLLTARRISAEFDAPARHLFERLCWVEWPKDKKLVNFMKDWPLDAIFPYVPLLDVVEAGCGFYVTRQGFFELPVRRLFEQQHRGER